LEGVIQKYKETNATIPADKIKRWCIEMLDGLDFLHKKGVIHFDIKSKNIFLDEIERVKLGDLGLARNLQSMSSKPTFRGTIPYMSPEVIKEERVDFRTDIWSFGCLLYEMITLKPLFPNRALHLIVNDILEMKIEIPNGLEADISHVLEK
jgi:serine/threonine protein kinase